MLDGIHIEAIFNYITSSRFFLDYWCSSGFCPLTIPSHYLHKQPSLHPSTSRSLEYPLSPVETTPLFNCVLFNDDIVLIASRNYMPLLLQLSVYFLIYVHPRVALPAIASLNIRSSAKFSLMLTRKPVDLSINSTCKPAMKALVAAKPPIDILFFLTAGLKSVRIPFLNFSRSMKNVVAAFTGVLVNCLLDTLPFVFFNPHRSLTKSHTVHCLQMHSR
ncbi:hypothetical protein BD560DRAFT_442943 [Blakeslea trispora]|nr:hypothetical protein BD560DRAFT_442943 [Blakeslea trispora]